MPITAQLPERLDLELIRGDAFGATVTIYDDAGAVQNLTGYTFEVRQTGQTPLPLTAALLGPAANGQVRITCATTAAARPRRYELVTTDGSSNKRTRYRGIARILGQVTD